MPDTRDTTVAATASTWMQVVFGGLGVCVAIVALVIAYFAWVQPNAPDDGHDGRVPPAATGAARTNDARAPAPAPASAATVALRTLSPTIGAGYIRGSGDDLVMACATGQTTDRHRTVEYDLLGRYTMLETEVRVSKARDGETPLQIKIFADGPETANRTLAKDDVTRMSVPLDGKQRMRIQLACQFPDGEITFAAPKLIHA